jgi:hypothetical protein
MLKNERDGAKLTRDILGRWDLGEKKATDMIKWVL